MANEHVQPDLGCAAYLLASGYDFAGLKEISPNRLGFVFADPARTCQQEAQSYFSGAPIAAEKLVLAIRTLKTKLRVAKDESEKEFKEYEQRPKSHPTLR